MNQAIHRLDLLQWLGGPIEFRVCAANVTIAHSRMNVEDLAVAAVRFEGGALGTIVASTATWPGYPARLGLYGERGAVEQDASASDYSGDTPVMSTEHDNLVW